MKKKRKQKHSSTAEDMELMMGCSINRSDGFVVIMQFYFSFVGTIGLTTLPCPLGRNGDPPLPTAALLPPPAMTVCLLEGGVLAPPDDGDRPGFTANVLLLRFTVALLLAANNLEATKALVGILSPTLLPRRSTGFGLDPPEALLLIFLCDEQGELHRRLLYRN